MNQEEATWFKRLLGWVNWFKWKDDRYDAEFLAIDQRFDKLEQGLKDMADAVDTALDQVRAEVAADFKALQDALAAATAAGNGIVQSEADKVTALVAELHAKYAPPTTP